MSVGTARYPAPAVQYPVGRSRSLAVVLLLLHLGSLTVLVAWLLNGAGAQRAAMLPSILVWVVLAASSVHFWVRLPVGALSWDGSNWLLRREDDSSMQRLLCDTVVVQVDVQRAIVLVFPRARPAAWLVVERHREPQRWLDLRRAVYSRPSTVRPPSEASQPQGRSS